MMFEDVMRYLREGKKIHRSGWRNQNYYLGQFPCFECDCDISKEDLLADDWELIDEGV